MLKTIIGLSLGLGIFLPIHSDAATKTSYLIYGDEEKIEEIKNSSYTVTTEFDVIPMIEVNLTIEEKSEIEESFPTVDISEVNTYETASSSDRVPFQFKLVKSEPEMTSPYTGLGVKVGVIDSGIDVNHADLKVVGGICTLNLNCSPGISYNDNFGHGTHVAGIIAALKNDYGMIGIAPNVELFAIKTMNKNGGGNTTDIAEGVEWAIQQKMDIINISITSDNNDLALKAMIQKAHEEGILIVAAAGNEGLSQQIDSVKYPAKYPEVIAVSATDELNRKLDQSSEGPKVELAAPGVDILSTFPSSLDVNDGKKDGFTTYSGTSMSSPHVVGILALYKERFPTMSNNKLRELLTTTALDLGTAGRDPKFGFGLVQYSDNILNLPLPILEESNGKILIKFNNTDQLKSSTLKIFDQLVIPSKENEWELYRLAGDYPIYIEYETVKGEIFSEKMITKVSKPTFNDVNNRKWYASPIAYLAYEKIINGRLDGTFLPEQNIKRAEAVALVGRVYGLNGEQRKTVFIDVNPSSFASGYIQSAFEENLLSGFPDGSFRPEQNVTRAEMAILLHNAYSFSTDPNLDVPFSDVSTGMVSYEAIQALFFSNITKGYTETQFKPDYHINRAAFSVFLARSERNDLFK